MLRVGALFAGIGGMVSGLERTGAFEAAWLCEKEPYPQKVLRARWPAVPIYPDVTDLKGAEVAPIDILTGGFPCQDISAANSGGAGIHGARSGLWFEFARLIGELRPRYVIAENSPALRTRGLGAVLKSLAEIGYDAEWACVAASSFGAPHKRDRLWIVAYPAISDADPQRSRRGGELPSESKGAGTLYPNWSREPGVPRVDDGVPDRVDRRQALGNSVVPAIPEAIGRRIIEWESCNA